MAKGGSVAPKERINIKYVPATSGQQDEKELPLRMAVVGDFLGKEDGTPVEERQIFRVDRNTFSSVMEEANIQMDFSVPNMLGEGESDDLAIKLDIKSLKDLEPDAIARQVPELKAMLELREALTALKGPLGNMPSFRKNLQKIIEDSDSRERLLQELKGITAGDNNTASVVTDEPKKG